MSKLKLKTIKEILSNKNGNTSQKQNEKEQERQEKEDYEAGENAAKNGETCPTSASQKFKEGFKKKEEETKNKKVNQKMKK